MDDCPFSTDVKRARAAHLLCSHHLLFRGRGLDPVPLGGDELDGRLEAFRRRNRGSRQRAIENLHEATAWGPSSRDCRSTFSTLAPEPVAGTSADIGVLEDEDWGDVAIDVQLLLEEDFADHGSSSRSWSWGGLRSL